MFHPTDQGHDDPAVKFVRNLKARVYHVPVPVRKLGGVQSIEVLEAVHFGE